MYNARICHVTRTHGIVLALALMVGLVYASHHFFIPLFFLDSEKEFYAPIAGDYGDEKLLYGPRAHDAFLNFGIRGDFSLAEFPKSPAIFPMLNPLLLGALGKIFGSMNAGIIASDIIFPSLIFFILYLVMREAGAGGSASVFFSTLFVMSPQFGISIPPVSSFHLRTLAQAIFPFLAKNEALFFSHFDEPKLTFLFFALCLYMILRALKRQTRGDIVLAGISFGVLFYTYLYDWATMLVSICLMAIYFLIIKDYRKFKILAAVFAMGICVSIYYWINLIMLKNLSTGQDVIARLGGEFSHQLRFATVWKSYARAVILAVFLWIYARRQAKEAVIVLCAVLLSYIVVVNEQVITGFNIQPDHWYRVQFLPIASAVFLLALALWRKFTWIEIKLYMPFVSLSFFLFFFVSAFYGQYVYSANHAHGFAISLERMQGYQWLNDHISADAVVGSYSFDENIHLQLYTQNKIFLPFGLSTIASQAEIWQRYMIMSRLWGLNSDEFADSFQQKSGAYYLFGDQYGTHEFDGHFFSSGWKTPNDFIEQKKKAYDEFIVYKAPFKLPYRLDYLFIDIKEFPSWREPRNLLPALTNVYDNGRIRIYKL